LSVAQLLFPELDEVVDLCKGNRFPFGSGVGATVFDGKIVTVRANGSCNGLAPMLMCLDGHFDDVVDDAFIPDWPPLDSWVRGSSKTSSGTDVLLGRKCRLVCSLSVAESDVGLLKGLDTRSSKGSCLLDKWLIAGADGVSCLELERDAQLFPRDLGLCCFGGVGGFVQIGPSLLSEPLSYRMPHVVLYLPFHWDEDVV
jgi:hypothetical protein